MPKKDKLFYNIYSKVTDCFNKAGFTVIDNILVIEYKTFSLTTEDGYKFEIDIINNSTLKLSLSESPFKFSRVFKNISDQTPVSSNNYECVYIDDYETLNKCLEKLKSLKIEGLD